jgi:hypothetical protein
LTPTPIKRRSTVPICSKAVITPLYPYYVQITHGGIPNENWIIYWKLTNPFTGDIVNSGSFKSGFKNVNMINNAYILTAETAAYTGYYINNIEVRRYSTVIL